MQALLFIWPRKALCQLLSMDSVVDDRKGSVYAAQPIDSCFGMLMVISYWNIQARPFVIYHRLENPFLLGTQESSSGKQGPLELSLLA
jgi:hypothetical protein